MQYRYFKEVDMRKMRKFEQELEANQKCKKAAEKFFTNTQIQTQCRICGSQDTQKYFTAYFGYEFRECKRCEALYMANPPANIADMYAGGGRKQKFANLCG